MSCQIALMDGTYNLPYLDRCDGMGQHNWGQMISQITQCHAKRAFIGICQNFELKPEAYWQLMQLTEQRYNIY